VIHLPACPTSEMHKFVKRCKNHFLDASLLTQNTFCCCFSSVDTENTLILNHSPIINHPNERSNLTTKYIHIRAISSSMDCLKLCFISSERLTKTCANAATLFSYSVSHYVSKSISQKQIFCPKSATHT